MTTATSQGRNAEQDKYALPRDQGERDRLEKQHGYLTETLNGALVVVDNVELGLRSHVLDSGIGAGSWIMSLSKNLPSNVDIVGIDISSSMFPRNIPDNIKLYEMSATNLPPDWENSFDLISQRLLLGAFTITQWKTELSELFRVLKPGGAIQLMEYGRFGLPEQACPASFSATKKTEEIFSAVLTRRGLVGLDSGRILSKLLEEAGFSDIRLSVYQAPVGESWGENGVIGAKNFEAIFRGVGGAFAADGWLDICNSVDEYYATIDRATEE